jgi:hypothetical protein
VEVALPESAAAAVVRAVEVALRESAAAAAEVRAVEVVPPDSAAQRAVVHKPASPAMRRNYLGGVRHRLE